VIVSDGISQENVRAIHLDGGNYFDDMRIDIGRSHERFDRLPRHPSRARPTTLGNVVKRYLTHLAMRIHIHEFLVVNGLRRRWFEEFEEYWSEILAGRPFWNTVEFFMLAHDYRKRQQQTAPLAWGSPAQHLANWQHPGQLYSTFHQVRKLAGRPIVAPALWNHISANMRILEYGCSLAPYYQCYRDFYSHLACRWVLADLPNFPFHYARYRYRNDVDVAFRVIAADDFTDPLHSADDFDVIVLTTVLEHVDDPVFVADYLLDRLKPGGLFVFDYIKSDARGLDHPRALEDRDACLQRILSRTRLLHGRIGDLTESIGVCIAEKRTVSEA
jgi:SAM-dependent methyltransferase